MSELLERLRQDACELLDHELPTPEETRGVLASLLRWLEDGLQRGHLNYPGADEDDDDVAPAEPVAVTAPDTDAPDEPAPPAADPPTRDTGDW